MPSLPARADIAAAPNNATAKAALGAIYDFIAELPAVMQSGATAYGIDTGAANAYVVAYTPAIAALTDGMVVRFKAAAANTGASTLSVGSPGAAPIVTVAHAALGGGEIIAGGQSTVSWNAALGAWVLLSSTGTQPPGKLLNARKITASGVYTPTPGTKAVLVELVGGGAPGGYAKPTPAGYVCATTGGSAGGYARSYLTAGFSGVMVTIGAGGIPSTSAVNGGTTSFGSLLSATGGIGAPPGDPLSIQSYADIQPSATVPATGTGIGGNLANEVGEAGWLGLYLTRAIGGPGGRSHFGPGGESVIQTASPGKPGVNPGSGGGGCGLPPSSAGTLGGKGADGMAIVWEFA